MMLLGYNRRLAWVAVGAILWALLALAAAASQLRAGVPPVSVAVGVPPGQIRLRGRLKSAVEIDGYLSIIVAARKGDAAELPNDLPHDLTITVEETEQFPPGPPEISLDGNPPRINRGVDSHTFETRRYVIRYSREGVRITPKPGRQQFRLNDDLRRQRLPWPDAGQEITPPGRRQPPPP